MTSTADTTPESAPPTTAESPRRSWVGPLLLSLAIGFFGIWLVNYFAFAALYAIGFADGIAAQFIAQALLGLLVGTLLVRRAALIGLLIGVSPFALFIFVFDVALYQRPTAYLELFIRFAVTTAGFAAGSLLRSAMARRRYDRRHLALAAAVAVLLALGPSLLPGLITTGHLGWRQFSPAQVGFGDLGYTIATPSDFGLGWSRTGAVTLSRAGHMIGVTKVTNEQATSTARWEPDAIAFNERLGWGQPDSVEAIEVAGRPAILLTYHHTRAIVDVSDFGVRESTDIKAAPNPTWREGEKVFTLQAIVPDGATAFVITSVSDPGNEAADEALFRDVLSTFRIDAGT